MFGWTSMTTVDKRPLLFAMPHDWQVRPDKPETAHLLLPCYSTCPLPACRLLRSASCLFAPMPPRSRMAHLPPQQFELAPG